MMDDSKPERGRLRREGDYWTIEHEGRVFRIRHMKGIGYLSRLLAEPGRLVPVGALVGSIGREDERERERERVRVTKAIQSATRKIAEHDPALGELLRTSVHTGRECSYRPPLRAPIRWEA